MVSSFNGAGGDEVTLMVVIVTLKEKENEGEGVEEEKWGGEAREEDEMLRE